MTINAGDTGHVAKHNSIETTLTALAAADTAEATTRAAAVTAEAAARATADTAVATAAAADATTKANAAVVTAAAAASGAYVPKGTQAQLDAFVATLASGTGYTWVLLDSAGQFLDIVTGVKA